MNQNEDKIVAEVMHKSGYSLACDDLDHHCQTIAGMLRECISLAREWIPVSERLPEDKVQVILWSSHGWATVGELRRYFRDEEWSFKNHADFPSECFTHWQPITPPTDERTREGSK